MVHEGRPRAVTRHMGCETGVDGELEGGQWRGASQRPGPAHLQSPGPGMAAHKELPRLSQALRDLGAHPW